MSHNETAHLLRLRERLGWYRDGTLGLHSLIADIDALISAVRASDPALAQALRAAWEPLEEVYAISLDREAPSLQPESRAVLDRAVAELWEIVTQRLS
jgi:hypothetical protein